MQKKARSELRADKDVTEGLGRTRPHHEREGRAADAGQLITLVWRCQVTAPATAAPRRSTLPAVPAQHGSAQRPKQCAQRPPTRCAPGPARVSGATPGQQRAARRGYERDIVQLAAKPAGGYPIERSIAWAQKFCRRCGKWKPSGEFHANKRQGDGRFLLCRSCHRTDRLRRLARHP